MRNAFCLSVALISMAALVRCYVLPHPIPEIECRPRAIHLGELNELEKAVVRFAVHNRSSVTYKVTGIQSTCHCTIPRFPSPQQIHPGASVPVSFLYDTGRGGGPREHRLFVLLERLDGPVSRACALPIKVTCSVRPELRSDPAVLDLGVVGPDSGCRQSRFTVRSLSGTVYTVAGIDTTSTWVSVAGPQTVGDNEAEFIVTLAPDNITAKGYLSGAIHVRLSGGRVSALSIPFKARLSPRFAVTPDTLVFDATSSIGSTATAVVESARRFRIDRVVGPASIRPLVPCQEFRYRQEVAVELATSEHGNLGEASVILRTESGTEHMVRLMIERAASTVGSGR